MANLSEPIENQAEVLAALAATAELEEQWVPVEPATIASATGLEVEVVKETMNVAWQYGLAFYVNEVSGHEGSRMRSWGGWTVTQAGYEFLEATRAQAASA
jgi:hypothetical protein